MPIQAKRPPPVCVDDRVARWLHRRPSHELAYRGSLLLLFWYEHEQGPLLRTVMTFETDGEHITGVRN
jgi:hypothetical protein